MDVIAEQVVKYAEVILQRVWADLDRGFEFKTISGDSLSVIYPGTWNLEEGPDFLNAEISVNGSLLTGDIEIHNTPADWYSHGHENDNLYANVILHVVKNSPIKSTKIPKIQTVLLQDFTIYEFLKKNKNEEVNYPEGLCISKFHDLSENSICMYLGKVGVNRLNNKVLVYTSEILKNGVDNAFLKYFFKACGYKKNKDHFIELYERISKYGIDKFDAESIAAVLWGESGFLPDPSLMKLDESMHEFVKSTWSKWWSIRKNSMDNKMIPWNLSAVRPLNSPHRRIAALSNLLISANSTPFLYYRSLFENEINDREILLLMIKNLNCNDPLWIQYVNFYKKINHPSNLIGKNRALEIIGNLILPFIIAYAKIKNDSVLGKKVFDLWCSMPSGQINIIQKIAVNRWGLKDKKISKVFKTFAAQQGSIFLHKNMCEFRHMNCKICPVIKNESAKRSWYE
jgi:hypothetical protein